MRLQYLEEIKMQKNALLVAAAVGSLIVASLACGSSNTGVQVGTSAQAYPRRRPRRRRLTTWAT